MHIVVLDGYALNPGDLSWKGLELLGDVTVYDRTPADQIYERAKEAEVLLTNKTPLSAEMLSRLPRLRYVGVLATGYNVVDVKAAKELGVAVTNVPAYSTPSVVQMTFSLLFALCTRAQEHSQAVREGKWCSSKDFCFWDYPLVEVSGKTLGIIGFGSIGRQVAEVALALGMQVVAYSRTVKTDFAHPRFSWVGLDELFAVSDVVSLHCPLFPETKEIINKANLSKMKPTAFLLNTARGGLVAEQDLADALNHGSIAGAGLDVLTEEPAHPDCPLLTAKNCVITPHIAWATAEARARLMEIAVSNLASFIEGKPVNVVNK